MKPTKKQSNLLRNSLQFGSNASLTGRGDKKEKDDTFECVNALSEGQELTISGIFPLNRQKEKELNY